jgi:hypothetical protein
LVARDEMHVRIILEIEHEFNPISTPRLIALFGGMYVHVHTPITFKLEQTILAYLRYLIAHAARLP